MAQSGQGPSLIEFDLERYLPHTSDDDDSVYRDQSDIDRAKLRDPLKKLKHLLEGKGVLTSAKDEDLHAWAENEINEATDRVESAGFPDAADVFENVVNEDS